MNFGVAWEYKNGSDVKVLMASPEALEDLDTAEKAKQDGRDTLSDLPEDERPKFRPLAVMELNFHMMEAVAKCPTIEISEDLSFHDVTAISFWQAEEFWPK